MFSNEELKKLAKNLLTPDQQKVIYRLNYTKKQAALALGIGVDKLQKKIDRGEIAVNFEEGEEKISRAECERYLANKRMISKNIRKSGG